MKTKEFLAGITHLEHNERLEEIILEVPIVSDFLSEAKACLENSKLSRWKSTAMAYAGSILATTIFAASTGDSDHLLAQYITSFGGMSIGAVLGILPATLTLNVHRSYHLRPVVKKYISLLDASPSKDYIQNLTDL